MLDWQTELSSAPVPSPLPSAVAATVVTPLDTEGVLPLIIPPPPAGVGFLPDTGPAEPEMTVAKEAAAAGFARAIASQNTQPRQRHQLQCSPPNAGEHHPKHAAPSESSGWPTDRQLE